MVDPTKVDRAVELIRKDRTARIYFFDKLNDPAWIGPLRERGFFSKPPEPIERDGGIAYPAWPESEYLVRMAVQAPDVVAATIAEMPETENFRVRADVMRAAAALPRKAASRAAERERAWVRERTWVWLDYPEAAAELAIHLAEQGAADQARDLLRDLLAVIPTGDTKSWRAAASPRMDRWLYQKVCREAFPRLVDLDGLPALVLAADLLESALEIGPDEERPTDYSEIWRPAIEDHEQNTGMDFRDDLISLIRDEALRWIGRDSTKLAMVIQDLEAREWAVFQRLALHVLARTVDVDRGQAVGAALNRASFAKGELLHEYMDLARAAFPAMSEHEQGEWLALLDRGPEWPSRDAEKRATEGISEEDYSRSVAIWRRDRLAGLEDALPQAWLSEFRDLSSQYGEADHPTFRMYSGSWVGPTSPRSEAELAEMDPARVIEYVRDWVPTGDPMSPSPEGLARLLDKRIGSDPVGFAKLSADLSDLDPTYVRAALNGFETAAKAEAGAEFEWEGVLRLAELAAQAPALDSEESAGTRESRDWDPDWRWCRKAAASVLETGMSREVIPLALADRVWGVLQELSWDPEPTLGYEERYGGSNMDPLTLSINTVRGKAMHAVVQYAAWRKAATEPDEVKLGDRPGVAENLEAHLNPEREESETVRAVFGSRLAQLYWIDSGWVQDHLPQIFPPDNDRLRLAAWETYLIWGRPGAELRTLLAEHYELAVGELPTPKERRARAGREPGLALAEHLGVFLWRGETDLDDNGLLHHFASRASGDDLGHLIDFLGRSLDDGEVEPPVATRLIAFWERFESWLETRTEEDRRTALAPFGSWYGSGALDPDWSDEQLLALLKEGVRVEPDFKVAERIKTRAVEDIQAAVRLVQAYIRVLGDDWRIYAARDEIRFVLVTALNSGEKTVAQSATQAVHDLGAKGFMEFRDVLGTKRGA